MTQGVIRGMDMCRNYSLVKWGAVETLEIIHPSKIMQTLAFRIMVWSGIEPGISDDCLHKILSTVLPGIEPVMAFRLSPGFHV